MEFPETALRGVSSMSSWRAGAGMQLDSWRARYVLQRHNGILYFVADDGIHGEEIWTSDGTPGGTHMVADLCPGECSSSVRNPIVTDKALLVCVYPFGYPSNEHWLAISFNRQTRFIRGDSNSDGATDISDAVATLSYLFLGDRKVPCEQAGDANDDGALDISDAIYTLSFLFTGGKPIEPPVGTCGADPTGHALPCSSFPACL